MARISRTELGEKLDEILDKVDKDNVGFVITDEGKDDLVLCPIRWIECAYETVKFTIGSDLYERVGEVLKRYGLTHEEAIRLFFKETVRLGRIPFEYTQEDLEEAKRLGGEVEIGGE
nr:type II toxin-antitoxin system RelB/DinJ family antitoxin [Anaerotruncus rubiinfantis]